LSPAWWRSLQAQVFTPFLSPNPSYPTWLLTSTPKGYVPVWAAIPTGILGAAFANYGTKLKFLLRIDDSLDIFAVHGIGGLVGNICTAFFAADYIAHLDGATSIKGGWLNHNWIQLPIQLADSFTGGLYSFVMTCLILFVLNLIPGMHLRASEESEILGIDDAEIGEFAYDYVELTREVLNDVEGDVDAQENVSVFSEAQQLHRQAPSASQRFSPGREKNSNGSSIMMMDYNNQQRTHGPIGSAT
jgi:Amt family ammonium transporter